MTDPRLEINTSSNTANASNLSSNNHRRWIDLHPKVAAALAVVLLLFALAFIVGVFDPDFFVETKELLVAAIGGLLALIPAYFKSGDGK